MPEMPEVETIVRHCRPHLVGRRILKFSSTWPRGVIPNPRAVRRALLHREITALNRRGKFIVVHLDDDTFMLIHLRMSGSLHWIGTGAEEPSHVRAAWTLDDDSRLLFSDARKFGRIIHTKDLDDVTANLGPEPLTRNFTTDRFAELLSPRNRQIKPLLLDQTVVAGLGNIYVDEALFRAGLHPARLSGTLERPEIDRLHKAIRDVLRTAIRLRGTSFDWAYRGGGMQRRLLVYGRQGELCVRCGTPISFLRIGQRGTHVCPRCQPAPRTRSKSKQNQQ